MSNAWATCPQDRDTDSKGLLIPDEVDGSHDLFSKGGIRLRRGLRSISWLVRQRLTKATMDSRPERVAGHTGTEIRPRLLRGAAVGNIAQWAKA